MSGIKEEAIYQLRDDLVVEEIDGEVIVLDLAGNRYFGLNPVGWSICKEIGGRESNQNEIVARIVENYQISEEEAFRDVRTFLDELVRAGLATVRFE